MSDRCCERGDAKACKDCEYYTTNDQIDFAQKSAESWQRQSQEYWRELEEIKELFTELSHPLAPGEPILEKIRDMAAIIKSQRELRDA